LALLYQIGVYYPFAFLFVIFIIFAFR
jgi:hypothetical protein